MTADLNRTNDRTRCEVYSRVVGYIRPVSQWNEGKQAEFADRLEFNVSDICK
jgi:anaerobic ribonucleoside-triphosphate reductase